MSICIFPGKFTPFHNGHLLVLKGMSKVCNRVIIAICHSSNQVDDYIFNKEQVQEMISEALLAEGLLEVEIKFIPDCLEDEEWMDRIAESAEGNDFTLWSGREDIISLFSRHGFQTKEIVHVPGHDSQEIADFILSNNPEWKIKVPKNTINIIEKIAIQN